MNEGVEIAPDVAAGSQSVITDQVANGVAVRMAVLYLLAGARGAAGVSAVSSRRAVRPWAPGWPTSRSRGPGWWIPATGREGPGEIVVTDGILEAVTWLEGAEADGVDASGIVVAPGFLDLHAHFREPGNEDAETIATGLAAAAHGGFTAVCVMPNTTPALDEPSVLARIRDAAAASGSPVALLAHGAVSAGRAGEQLAALGELADAGVVGFSDDGAPVQSASLFRNALAYAGMLGLPIVDHPEDPTLTDGAEANEGLVATVLGLRGWPGAAEAGAVARDIAILADVVRDVPGRAAAPDAPLHRGRRSSSCEPRRRPACRSPAT